MLFFIGIAIMFFVGAAFYEPTLKFFLIWLAVCAAIYFLLDPALGFWGFLLWGFFGGSDEYSEKKPKSSRSSSKSSRYSTLYDKRYEDGTTRDNNLSNTGYYYSDGKTSWTGIFDEEHRSNGEVVYDNAYLPGRRDIYNAAGEYIGYEYEDAIGVTHRVDK